MAISSRSCEGGEEHGAQGVRALEEDQSDFIINSLKLLTHTLKHTVVLLHQLQAWQSIQRDQPLASAKQLAIAHVPWSFLLWKEEPPTFNTWRRPLQT